MSAATPGSVVAEVAVVSPLVVTAALCGAVFLTATGLRTGAGVVTAAASLFTVLRDLGSGDTACCLATMHTGEASIALTAAQGNISTMPPLLLVAFLTPAVDPVVGSAPSMVFTVTSLMLSWATSVVGMAVVAVLVAVGAG